jgi:competence protein ComEA
MSRTIHDHRRSILVALILAACAFGLAGVAAAQTRVNVNTATEAELLTLSGIGPARARAIIAHREQHGPFTSIDALTQVSGIGPGILSRIRDQVTVGDGAGGTPTPAESPRPAEPEAPQTRTLPPRPAEAPRDGDFDLDLTQDSPGPSTEARQAALAARQAGAASPPQQASPPAGETRASQVGRINVNTADEETLVRLPGIGPARAKAIIAHRAAQGPFRTAAQLTEVSGIGPATFRNLENLITVQLDLNTAGLAELEAIGLDQAAAERLIAWRSSNGPFRSIEQLTEVPGFGRGALETLRPLVRVEVP